MALDKLGGRVIKWLTGRGGIILPASLMVQNCMEETEANAEAKGRGRNKAR